MSSLPIPHAYGLWRHNMQRYIHNAPDHHRSFWLIDPCAHNELPGLIWKLDPQPDGWPLYMNTYMEEAINFGPFMVPYRQDSKFTNWMLQELRLLPLGCLIELEAASVHTAFEHLQNLLECQDAEGKRSIFRFYDPRIVYGINTYEDKAVVPRILGPLLRLLAWEPGRCMPISMGNGFDSGIRSAGIENYDQKFLEHIWDEVKIHSTIGTLGRETGIKLRNMPLPDAYQFVEEVNNILRQYSYTDRYSLAYGTSISLRLGLSIWKGSDLQEALETRPANAPLSEIMESHDI